MKYCTKCGAQIYDEAVVCVNCGCAVGKITEYDTQQEYNILCIIGFILSFFMSFVGLILCIIGLNQVNKNPNQKGKTFAVAGIWICCATVILSIIFLVVFMFLLMIIVSSYMQHITSLSLVINLIT